MHDKIIQQTLKSLNLNNKVNIGTIIGSHWIKNKNALTISSYDPCTTKKIADVTQATEKNANQLIQKSHQAFLKWRTVPAPKRGEIIRQISLALREKKRDLATLVTLETGKIYQEALGEVQEMIDMADFAVGQSRMLYGLTMHSERSEHRMYEQWHPLGVVGIISAFNFPVAVWSWNAFIAIITGNTVIWKPSSKTPLCAIAIQHICADIIKKNKLPDIFSLMVSNEKIVSSQLLDSSFVPLISFTGSTPVGHYIQAQVSKRLGKCLLELGGNNAIIVDETANIDLATRAITFGAIGTSGQRCTTTRRVIVHQKVYKKLVRALENAYKQITIGDPLKPKTLMGPLIDASSMKKHETAIQLALNEGGKILASINQKIKSGHFVSPVIIKAENHWDIVQKETFSPILWMMTYQNFQDAIQIQNTSQHGLSSALFTNDIKNAELFLSSMGSDCGIANINIGTSGAEIGGAFGGEKQTGGGREAGSDAWKFYMRRQTNTINWGNDLPLAQGIKF